MKWEKRDWLRTVLNSSLNPEPLRRWTQLGARHPRHYKMYSHRETIMRLVAECSREKQNSEGLCQTLALLQKVELATKFLIIQMNLLDELRNYVIQMN